MLSKQRIRKLFELLNEKLASRGEVGEVGIVGGAVMCLVFDARQSTKDVDGVFKPTTLIRKLVAEIGEEEKIDEDWLNDAAKGYLTGDFSRVDVLNLSHLRVWAPEPKYMLAMKCVAARWDSSDKKDVAFLIKLLRLKKATEVFKIIEWYYPKNRIPPKTQFLIEELVRK